MASPSRPLELVFIPFLTPSHMMPLFEMARLFAARGEHVTIVTTPSNGAVVQKTIDRDAAAGLHIRSHLVPFPSKEVGLPEGLENFFSAKDLLTASKLYQGMTILRHSIEEFIDASRPDCIVSDIFHPWTTEVTIRLRIPLLFFVATCIYAKSVKNAMRSPDSPHLRVQSDDEPFVVPGLPDPITLTKSQLPDFVRTPNGFTQLNEEWREAELKSYGVVVNNFSELEPAYIEHYQQVMGIKVFHIGPAALIHRNAGDKVERGHKTVVGQHECLSFLDSKQPNSVLYVCFGSVCIFPDDQLMELASGLEASGHQFIWVVFGKDNDQEEKWLPKGFRERTKEKCMIIKGWAPQVLILDHPSIGGFMTHCGWNSVIEGISAGVPMITWPLYSDHFYIEKLVTQLLKIGVEVGKKDWNSFVDAGKEVVTREKIERAVRRLMNDGDLAALKMREKAKELKEMARRAVEEGGSSHRNLTVLIEELKQLREQKG